MRGAIRYETSSEPIPREPRHRDQVVKRKWHGAWIPSRPSRAIERDNYGRSEHLAGSGRQRERKVHAFCPTCGTPVHISTSGSQCRNWIAVNATSLGFHPGQFNPQVAYTPAAAKDTIDLAAEMEPTPPG